MRPKIICHMISSVDGRLLVERWTPPALGIDLKIVSETYEQVASRLGAQGWIVGRKSMEPMAKGEARPLSEVQAVARRLHIGKRDGGSIAVAIDPHGKLHYGRSHIGDEHFVAVLGHQVSDEYLTELQEDGVSYLFAGNDGLDLEQAMETLGNSFGIESILLEGGGVINGAFLKAGLIDELSLLVYPGIDGLSGISSIFEYLGGNNESPASGRSLRHLSTETLEGGIVWIRYSFEDSPISV
ncbi:5-amino-6-(5-phosphoribosylamino)uracil reductase [Serratia sp. 3ACOL1]|uniref:RibD family protein n=1 Tax=Serratia sp. 3ACOL1 TaxID=2448483 RepID=UPI000EF54A9F|nr:dihydrofolate reductase family protein [Serratia sp. 3ACOL1]AYM91018.1 5-amino-6-(5-phosphoribosylamino)uracil reductase [Serratia sp. 3ACOL1]